MKYNKMQEIMARLHNYYLYYEILEAKFIPSAKTEP